jgi:NADPH2:quinone reductase
VLVTGAAGGVGTAMLQVAAVSGAHVVASARRPELHEQLKKLLAGANADVITPDVEADNGPYDVIVDQVGGPDYLNRVRWLAPRGVLLLVGMMSPPPSEVSPQWLGALMLNRCRIIGTTIRGRTNGEKAILAGDMKTVLPLLAERRLQVPVEAAFPLERYAEAYARLAAPGKLGKIIITNDVSTA